VQKKLSRLADVGVLVEAECVLVEIRLVLLEECHDALDVLRREFSSCASADEGEVLVEDVGDYIWGFYVRAEDGEGGDGYGGVGHGGWMGFDGWGNRWRFWPVDTMFASLGESRRGWRLG